MPKINIDMRDDVVLLPPDRYEVEVESVELKEARAGGHYLNFRLVVVDGKHEGAVLWSIASMRPDLVRLFRNQMRALGFDADEMEIEYDEESIRSGAKNQVTGVQRMVTKPDFFGRRAIAVVVHDEWDGDMRAKVKTLLPLPDDDARDVLRAA